MQETNTILTEAATLIRSGHVVVFPTDTVYGIGCDPWNADAIDALYDAKERPEEKGLPVLISDADVVERLTGVALTGLAATLAHRFWPGALTLILPKHESLPPNIAPGDTIAVRLPDLQLTRSLIDAAGGAVATSSANISGQPAATSVEAAREMLGGRVATIVDGGPSLGGVPSTIVDCTSVQPRILRAGPLDLSDYL